MQKRLLIIDDEADFAKIVARVGNDLGYLTQVTTEGEAFKSAAAQTAPDVIVLDIVMPDIEGLELIRWLAETGYRGRLIIVTGYNPLYARMGEALAQAKGMGSVVVRTKPIDLASLRDVLGA